MHFGTRSIAIPAALLASAASGADRTIDALASTCAELLAMPGTFGELIVVGGAEVGISLARVAADEAELLTIGVLPGHRQRGLAQCLLQRLLAAVRQRGANAVFLEVAEDNAVARNFYRKEGFLEVGRRPGYYGDATASTIAAIVMRRVVATSG